VRRIALVTAHATELQGMLRRRTKDENLPPVSYLHNTITLFSIGHFLFSRVLDQQKICDFPAPVRYCYAEVNSNVVRKMIYDIFFSNFKRRWRVAAVFRYLATCPRGSSRLTACIYSIIPS